MKKITFILALIGAFAFQVEAQNSDITSLLAQLKTLSNSPLSVSQVVSSSFSEADQATLNAYFASRNTQGTNNRLLSHTYYAEDLFINPGNFGTMPGAGPFVINNIATLASLQFADDFAGDGTTLYALDFNNTRLITVDTGTGAVTPVGPLTGLLTGHTITGLSWNFVTSIMYGSSTDGAITQLYSVNIATGTLIPIGVGTGNALGIWLEIDNDGNAFMADIGDDTFYSVDLVTGLSTPIGPLGIDIGFAQDVTVDTATNTLYMAGLINGGAASNIYSVNKATGATTLVGSSGGSELGMFSVGGMPPIVGFEDNVLSQVSIFPNPATDVLYVNIPSTVTITRASLVNVLGKDTGMRLVNGEMNISSLAQGVYILTLNTSAGNLTQKVIKK